MSFTLLPAVVALLVIVVFQGFVILGLVRTLSDLQAAAEGGRLPRRLPDGAEAPRLQGTDIRTGETVDTGDLLGRELLVLFLSDDCPTCLRLADGTRQVPVEPRQSRIAVCHGDRRRADAVVAALASDFVVLADPDGTLFGSYGISGTPAAIVIDETGIVRGSGGPQHAGELAALVR